MVLRRKPRELGGFALRSRRPLVRLQPGTPNFSSSVTAFFGGAEDRHIGQGEATFCPLGPPLRMPASLTKSRAACAVERPRTELEAHAALRAEAACSRRSGTWRVLRSEGTLSAAAGAAAR